MRPQNLDIITEGMIYSVEPEAANFRRLKENVETNQFSNVRCIEQAFSDYRGAGQLSLSGENFGDHILDPTNLLDPRPKMIVDIITGDNYFANELELQRIDLIKMDVQGSEAKILAGLKETIKKFDPVIMIEYSPRNFRLY